MFCPDIVYRDHNQTFRLRSIPLVSDIMSASKISIKNTQMDSPASFDSTRKIYYTGTSKCIEISLGVFQQHLLLEIYKNTQKVESLLK